MIFLPFEPSAIHFLTNPRFLGQLFIPAIIQAFSIRLQLTLPACNDNGAPVGGAGFSGGVAGWNPPYKGGPQADRPTAVVGG